MQDCNRKHDTKHAIRDPRSQSIVIVLCRSNHSTKIPVHKFNILVLISWNTNEMKWNDTNSLGSGILIETVIKSPSREECYNPFSSKELNQIQVSSSLRYDDI